MKLNPAVGRGVLFVVWGSLAFFPPGLVPPIFKLSGEDSRVWFLALYLPIAWQWPVIAEMLLLGAGLYLLAGLLLIRERSQRGAGSP